ncbi:hypothetical protein N0V82_008531 [Gnomoniopsis sp. IMI 355080]|nr:hypothetical protein N0V82_008531 [Gnomoniopsis sp. IMI 355080]
MPATFLITGATGLIGFRVLVTALKGGHKVRYAVRSEEKAKIVSSNPAVQKLGAAALDRLSSAVIPDFAIHGAFDEALKGVTHVIHVGSPVPMPYFDPKTQIFEPTIKNTAGLLQSALKVPTVQRVVLTSSIVANLGLPTRPQTATVSAATRVSPPNRLPETFTDVMEAYILGKMVEMENTDNFIKTQKPHFKISHVMPGYVFGRNDLELDVTMMDKENSSNNFLMVGMLGGELPFPIHGAFAHIDDVAELHLRVALDEAYGNKDVGIATKVDYSSIFDCVKGIYPEAVEAGVLKKGTVPTLPVDYDSSDATALLGGLRSFESAVADVASQYLELLRKE